MKTKILRKLLSLIPDKDTEWSFQTWNYGRSYDWGYGILSAGKHLGIHVDQDGKRGNVLAAYVAACSPEKIHELLQERDELLEACKSALAGYQSILELNLLPNRGYDTDTRFHIDKLRHAIFNAEYEPKPIGRDKK